MSERNYEIEVHVIWTQVTPAMSERQAIKRTQDTFYEEYGFTPDVSEIKVIGVVETE